MNKRINIFYVWGYGSSPESNTYNLIKKYLSNKHFNVISDYYAQYDPKEALIDLNTYITKYNIDLVIGSSLGGFLTMQIPNVKKIVINPCIHPENELEKLTQEVQRADEDGNPLFDDNREPIIDNIPAVPQHIINFYKEYAKENDVWDNTDDNLLCGIFADNDELFGDKFKKEFECHNIKTIDCVGGHHNSEEAIRNTVIPIIKNIVFSNND